MVVTDIGLIVDPDQDSVKVDGQYIDNRYDFLYYKYYKPKSVLSTMEDPEGRPCIGGVIRSLQLPIKPVGRLDRQTTGLMILTNDGDFAQTLMHPSYESEKRYECGLDKPLTQLDLKRIKAGLFLDDGPVKCERVKVLKNGVVVLSIRQGRHRVVRRLFECLGYKVKQLQRLSIGSLTLEKLDVGQVKPLTKIELTELRQGLE